MKNNKKGQAAMEYLMTYGWALLVIVIVLALLLIILGGYLQGTPSCMFEEAGFICNDPVTPVIDSDTNCIYGQFQHAQNEPIEINGIAFVEGQVTKDAVTFEDASITISPRSPISFSNITDSATGCVGVSGSLTPGSQVRGQLWVSYNYASDDTIGFSGNRTAVATVIANVE